jgi:hypothetical protein
MLSKLKRIVKPNAKEGTYTDLHYVKESIKNGGQSERDATVLRGNGEKYEYSLEEFENTRSIFIHVPRAAGSSICHSLFGNCGGGHKTARGYRHSFGPWYRWYFVFTFVRNPFSRLVSAYDYLRKGGHPAWPSDREFGEDVIGAYDGFSDFVLQWLRPDRTDFPKPHFYPQVHFLEIDDRLAVDFIGSVESIEEDYSVVRETLGISASLQKQNESPGERKPLAKFYTRDAVVRRVRRVYKDDFERLGYPPEVDRAGTPPTIKGEQGGWL